MQREKGKGKREKNDQRFLFPVLMFSFAVALSGCRPKPDMPARVPEQIRYDEGIALLHRGDLSGAHADFETAIRLNHGFAPAYLAQADMEVRTGHLPEAIQDMEALRRAAPNTPHVLCRLAELHAATGRFVEALNAAK